MKINKKILSLPPYLSTSWDYIAALRLQGTDLQVMLTRGETVTIPNLKPDLLETIFDHHVLSLEERDARPQPIRPAPQLRPAQKPSATTRGPNSDVPVESLFKVSLGSTDSMNAAMQHNPELANTPDLPKEVLEKIGAISKIIAPDDVMIPKAEPHCNCPYCQIARAIHSTLDLTTVDVPVDSVKVADEEEVSEEELRFQEWEITQSGDKLFSVVNKLDSHEKYSVYLGHPVGCTCGKDGCEHILAVLRG